MCICIGYIQTRMWGSLPQRVCTAIQLVHCVCVMAIVGTYIYIYRYLARASLWVQRCCVGWLLNSICCEPPLPCQPFGLPAWMAAHSSLHRFLLECCDVACLVPLFRTIVRFRSSGLSATRMHVHQLPLKFRRQ